MIELKSLPFPPSLNKRHAFFQGRLIKSREARSFDSQIKMHLHRNHMTADASGFIGKELKVTLEYHGPKSKWYTVKGLIKRIDIDNRAKSLLDHVMPFLDLDDSQIFELVCRKVVGTGECVHMKIEEL